MKKERRKEKNRENIPQVLKELPIWVGFKFTPQKDKKDKPDKSGKKDNGK